MQTISIFRLPLYSSSLKSLLTIIFSKLTKYISLLNKYSYICLRGQKTYGYERECRSFAVRGMDIGNGCLFLGSGEHTGQEALDG